MAILYIEQGAVKLSKMLMQSTHCPPLAGWSKKRCDDGTPGGRYATGLCPVVVYVRRTHDGTLARGVVQATGQMMRHV